MSFAPPPPLPPSQKRDSSPLNPKKGRGCVTPPSALANAKNDIVRPGSKKAKKTLDRAAESKWDPIYTNKG